MEYIQKYGIHGLFADFRPINFILTEETGKFYNLIECIISTLASFHVNFPRSRVLKEKANFAFEKDKILTMKMLNFS